jgi:uncharacterized protein (DUF885 family)
VTDDLASLAADYFAFRLRTAPTWAHQLAHYEYADRFEDASRAAEDAEIEEDRGFAARAARIPVANLAAQDRISREMLIFDAGTRADLAEARLAEFDVDPVNGPQAMLPVLVPKLPLPTPEIAEAMVGKYRGIAQMFRTLGARYREGIARGRTPATFAVGQAIEQVDRWLALPLEQDPLLALAAPAGMPDLDSWRARLRAVVAGDVRPALADYRAVLHDEVLPHARLDEECGLAWLPDGQEAYRRAIRLHTTRDLSPQEIHQVGLREVARLADEYRALGPAALGTNDLGRIFEALRSDPALHCTSGPQLVAASQAALAKAQAAIGSWFGVLPRAGCEVEETNAGAVAFYFPPAPDGSRGGVFFMNTAEPTAWGCFDIESTVYHEGIPGHHLQLAISGELTDVPDFRKFAWVTAYGEGWALYAERLADEMGLYSGPLDRIGMLSNDSMRACRLVVDTGIHALGWGRERAVAYMLENSPMREPHARAEIDRYIAGPGQALAYMLGRIEIQRIRREAEEALGDRFQIAAFHDMVLTSGCVPLETLDRMAQEWVSSILQSHSAAARPPASS